MPAPDLSRRSHSIRPTRREPHLKIRPQTIYRITTALSALGFFTHATLYVRQGLLLPPIDEVYTATMPFQLTAFMYEWGFHWLGGLIVVLLLAFALYGRRTTSAL